MAVSSLAHLSGVALCKSGFDVEKFVTSNNLPERLIPRRYTLVINSPDKKLNNFIMHQISFTDDKYKVTSVKYSREAFISNSVDTIWDTLEEMASFISCTLPDKPLALMIRGLKITWSCYVPLCRNVPNFGSDLPEMPEQTIRFLSYYVKQFVEVN